MHQKIILCDRTLAGVGTINLDNRSFSLNFEVMVFAIKSDSERSTMPYDEPSQVTPDLVESVEKMLLDDLNASRLIDLSNYQKKTFLV